MPICCQRCDIVLAQNTRFESFVGVNCGHFSVSLAR